MSQDDFIACTWYQVKCSEFYGSHIKRRKASRHKRVTAIRKERNETRESYWEIYFYEGLKQSRNEFLFHHHFMSHGIENNKKLNLIPLCYCLTKKIIVYASQFIHFSYFKRNGWNELRCIGWLLDVVHVALRTISTQKKFEKGQENLQISHRTL